MAILNDGELKPQAMDRGERNGGGIVIDSSHYPRSQVGFNRFAIICGPVAGALFFLFLPASLLLPPISPSATAEATVNHYRKNVNGLKGGIALMLLSVMFWPMFCAGINRQLARIPGIDPTVLWVQFGSGCIGGVAIMLSALLFASTIYRLDRDPAMTQLLSDTAWLFTIMPFPPFVAQELAISYAILSDHRPVPLFPHWLAWANTALSFTYYPALGAHCVHHGPIAWNGALAFWLPSAGFLIQLVLLVFYFLKAAGKSDENWAPSVQSDEYVGHHQS